ncbi:MAG: ATP-dependent helicase [Elusimicrobiota bacterium]|nr:ATP-dependent helicase [Elusimicrobiota bacterium]
MKDIQKYLEKINPPKNRQIFEKFISGFDDEQISAVLHNHEEDGHLSLISGPGTGKTRILTLRILYLILAGVPPRSIFAVTFTEKSSSEIKKQVLSLLEEIAVSGGVIPNIDSTLKENRLSYYEKQMLVSTFHAVGLRILLKFMHPSSASALSPNTSLPPEFPKNGKVISGLSAKEFLRQIAEKSKLPTDDIFLERAKNYVHIQKSFLKKPAASSLSSSGLERFYAEYVKLQKDTGFVDFQDVINLPLELLEKNDALRKNYFNHIEHILIDEFQEISIAELRFLEIIAADGKKIFITGDDDQTIYSWQGAVPENFGRFLDRYADKCKLLKLEKNYRSTAEIVRLTNGIFKDKPKKNRKMLVSARAPRGEKTVVYEAEDDVNEAAFIASEIQSLLKTCEIKSLGDVAVLTRITAQFPRIQNIFEKIGLKTTVMSVSKYWDKEEISFIISLLSLADFLFSRTEKSGPAPKEIQNAAEFIFNVFPFRLPPDLMSYSLNQKISINFPSVDIFMSEDKAARFFQNIREPDKAKEIVDFLKNPSRHQTEKLSDFCRKMMLLHGYAKKKFQPSEIKNLRDFMAMLDRFELSTEPLPIVPKLRAFLEHLVLLQNPPQSIERDPESENAVKLATVHRAKGLEFPVVFVAGLEDDIFPHKHYSEDQMEKSEIEKRYDEEKRLFYVSVTRAQNRLYITYARKRILNHQELSLPPSRYLEFLEPDAVVRKSFSSGRPVEPSVFFRFKEFVMRQIGNIATFLVLATILFLYITKPKGEIFQMTKPASVLRGLKSGATNFLAISKSKTVSKEEKHIKFPDEGIKSPRALWLYNRGFTVLPMPSWELNLPTYYDSEKSKYVGTYNSSGKITKLYPIKTAKLLCKIDPELLGNIPAPDELFESQDIFLDNYIGGKKGFLTVVKSATRLEYIYTAENPQK